ncbi:hypothetical protein JAO29_06175 [Edaphobacter sp. HDX4]|uniref:hypothetical protein n=1 Tax=Edaphobacter sp. HDX4 TaxID=2794064 RepID=UPI002FE5B4D1
MTKILSLASLAVMSVALQAQSTASPQTPDPAMTPGTTQTGSHARAMTDAGTPQQTQKAEQVQAASVAAEFTKGIDTKKAKVGDEVNAKTISEAKLPDGTALPKGTKLVGNVVDVKAKSKEQNDSHLVLALNRAVLKDGKEVPIRAAVTSMTAPTLSSNTDMAAGGAAMGSTPMGGSPGAAGAGGSTAGAAAPVPSSPTMAAGEMNSPSQTAAPGQMLKNATDRVAVGNKPKVMLSAPSTPESAGVLDAQGENISLESGTKFTANVAPAQALGQAH